MLGHVDELVVDCAQPRRPAEFWAAVLGGSVHERDDDWVYVVPPGWTQLSFQRVPEVKVVKNRLHIDVAVTEIPAALARAEQLGARRMGTIQHSSGGSFLVLHDPEGNEWCLVQPNQP